MQTVAPIAGEAMGSDTWTKSRLANMRLIFGRRRREVVGIGMIGVGAGTVLYLAYMVDPNHPDAYVQALSINLGTSLLFALFAYVLLDRIVQRVQESTTTEWANLDHGRLIERMRRATRRIMIIEIWTGLLDNQRFHEDFLPMVGRALKRGVQVSIYLNHPDSDVAKDRTAQLVTIDAREKILLNLGRLRDFVEDEENHTKIRHLRVLVGQMHPDIQVYCWDDRALLTFYSTDRPTYDVPQIETHVTNTPWGVFVDEKMEALARDPKTMRLKDYLYLYVELRNADSGEVEHPKCPARYVVCHGKVYIRDEWLAEDAVESSKLVAAVDSETPGTFPIRRAYGDAARMAKQAFREKYSVERESLFELVGLQK